MEARVGDIWEARITDSIYYVRVTEAELGRDTTRGRYEYISSNINGRYMHESGECTALFLSPQLTMLLYRGKDPDRIKLKIGE